ncbi:tyrosine-type recombinase/integrase [Bradyrhizobium cenepequi]|uniref:tyrosine-type recombinase/integrase n=1 Tax=Bradyrhizobium cenepequi TaxID=2821403 RepID=UPI001CE2CA72|nr:tyrosine-type recombinase/integrase [Bradyrhizobium cenepequi]MCA6108561.1 tyrosine-type recombinase/integrase [Bradyrhizobium cenepequi]
MAKTLTEAQITTAKARSRLDLGVHWRRLDAEAHLGYRKGNQSGVWFVRWRNHYDGANYKQASLGIANDVNDKPAEGTLTFEQAAKLARESVTRARTEAAAQAAGPAPTVRTAVEAYIKKRDARDSRRVGREIRSDAGHRLRRYVLGQDERGHQDAIEAAPLAAVALHALKEDDLMTWREGLPEELKATTKQRLINDLKAALNGAWPRLSEDQKRLNPTFLAIVRGGFKAERMDDDDEASVARDNQILTNGQIGALLLAAREIDIEQEFEGDLYRIVVCLAATGARYAQVRRMRVGDAQRTERRLMVPGSYKGRGGNGGSVPVPVGADVLEVLLPAITGRPNEATLFERWAYEQEPDNIIAWKKSERGPWKKAEIHRPWQLIRDRAGMPEVIPYAFRHSSIVRGLRKGLPIQHVAKLHNTSVKMIEAHYAKYIATALEDLARAAVVPLVPKAGMCCRSRGGHDGRAQEA